MTKVTDNSSYEFIFIFNSLYMFRAHRARHQERQIVSIQPLVAVTLCRWPCRLQVRSSYSTARPTDFYTSVMPYKTT